MKVARYAQEQREHTALKLLADGVSPAKVCKQLRISRSTLWRYRLAASFAENAAKSLRAA